MKVFCFGKRGCFLTTKPPWGDSYGMLIKWHVNLENRCATMCNSKKWCWRCKYLRESKRVQSDHNVNETVRQFVKQCSSNNECDCIQLWVFNGRLWLP